MTAADSSGFYRPKAAPIRCDACGGNAHLIRRVPDAFKRGQAEIWTYECAGCGRRIEVEVEA